MLTSTMVDYQYDSNIFRRLGRRRRLILVSIVGGFALLLIVGLIIYDGLTARTTVSEPIATQVTLGQSVQQHVFDNPTYRLTTDDSWQEVEFRSSIRGVKKYQSVVDNLVKREITIYVNNFPRELPVTHVMPVEVNGDLVTPLEISPKCDGLQPNERNKRDVTLSWAGVEFLCDPDLQAFVAAASHNETGYGIEVTGTLSDATYLFEYRDFEEIPQPSQFEDLLRDFQAK